MITRNRVIIATLVCVALVLAAAIPLVIRYKQRDEVLAAVTRYTSALDVALTELQPEALGGTALPRETGRVASYITLLYGRNVYMESELVSLELKDVQSAEPTVTAIVHEKWRYTEYDRRSRKKLGKAQTEENDLKYTLVRGDGGLSVYLSEIVEKDVRDK